MGYVDTLRRDLHRVWLVQSLITILMASAFGVAKGLPEVWAALYGGLITLLITGWLARRVRQAGQTTASPAAGLVVIYTGAVVRYATVIVLVGAGIGLLKLAPIPLLSVFAVTQFGFLANMHTRKR